MDLFDYMRQTNQEKEAPLAARLRPRTLDEVVGQQHIIGKDKLLYRAIQADKLSSIIFYGPPGTGKTTLARVIANTTSAEFMQINATVAGKKDMEEVVAKAKDNRGMFGKKTILFIDEIHRFNKSQQDYLLPFVEDGTLILIGATTENPYFEVNGALLSRSVIFDPPGGLRSERNGCLSGTDRAGCAGVSGGYCRRGCTCGIECSRAWRNDDTALRGWKNPSDPGGCPGMYSKTCSKIRQNRR